MSQAFHYEFLLWLVGIGSVVGHSGKEMLRLITDVCHWAGQCGGGLAPVSYSWAGWVHGPYFIHGWMVLSVTKGLRNWLCSTDMKRWVDLRPYFPNIYVKISQSYNN